MYSVQRDERNLEEGDEIEYLREKVEVLEEEVRRLEEEVEELKESKEVQTKTMEQEGRYFDQQKLQAEEDRRKVEECYLEKKAQLEESEESLAKKERRIENQDQELKEIKLSHDKLEQKCSDQKFRLEYVTRENERLKSRKQTNNTAFIAQESTIPFNSGTNNDFREKEDSSDSLDYVSPCVIDASQPSNPPPSTQVQTLEDELGETNLDGDSDEDLDGDSDGDSVGSVEGEQPATKGSKKRSRIFGSQTETCAPVDADPNKRPRTGPYRFTSIEPTKDARPRQARRLNNTRRTKREGRTNPSPAQIDPDIVPLRVQSSFPADGSHFPAVPTNF